MEMREQPYDSEGLLQGLLAQYPDLLAGDQVNPGAPRRWLLVARELPVPGDETGAGRWSLDHLFLDQDAVPTIVEVKRSTDGRIRREVVGQMLDYAANAVAYWPVDELRTRFEATCAQQAEEPGDAVLEFLGDGGDPEEFWSTARTNLRAGKLRLVFVADVIPAELQRVADFLNDHFDIIDVVAIEIRQYAGDGIKALVPRVVGHQQRAVGMPTTQRTTRDAFLDSLDDAGKAFFGAVLALADAEGLPVHWGSKGFSLNADVAGAHIALVYGYPPKSVYRQTVYAALGDITRKVRDGESVAAHFRERLSEIGGFVLAGRDLKRAVDGGLAGDDAAKLLDVVRSVAQLVVSNGPARTDDRSRITDY